MTTKLLKRSIVSRKIGTYKIDGETKTKTTIIGEVLDFENEKGTYQVMKIPFLFGEEMLFVNEAMKKEE